MHSKNNQKYSKMQEQQDYQKLIEENAQREIANEAAYKKRFEDFDKKVDIKAQKYHSIINENEYKRNNEIDKITGLDKRSFYDYYNDREVGKIKKSGEMKDVSYKSMRDTIDRNNKNIHQMSIQKREDAKKSVEELQNFHMHERNRKQHEKEMQKEYRSILETQVKMKQSPGRFNPNYTGPAEIETSSDSNMFMIPGINSISPYVKHTMKSQIGLGEHFSKMKNYIDKDKVSNL
jgi:hypothetical protein